MPERFDMRKQASITIFMIMSLSMVMSLFFTMSEVVRYFCMKSTADTLTSSAAGSGLGDYNRLLYEKYGILAVDMGYGRADADAERLTERITAYISEGGNPVREKGLFTYVNLCRMDPEDPSLDEVTLLTDYGGAAFIKEAAIQEVYDIPKDTLDRWQEAGEAAGRLSAALSDVEEPFVYSVGKGSGAAQTKTDGHGISGDAGNDEGQSIVDAVTEFKKKGVLAQVMGPDMSVSRGTMDIKDAVSKRTLKRGDGSKKQTGISDKLLFRLYLLDHFSSFADKKERQSLAYEVEYIISGKDSDEENLRSVVKRLLALREAENMVSLAKDGARRHEAETMAMAASAAVANPELAPLITAAIMAAWAYVESVLDVRLLLSGGKVPLIKDSTEWTSELAMLPEYLDTGIKARDVPAGLDYKGYMYALLCITPQEKLGLRPLDIMEGELHASDDYSDVRMDNMLVGARYSVSLTGTPLFLSLAPLIRTELSAYSFSEEKYLSYL